MKPTVGLGKRGSQSPQRDDSVSAFPTRDWDGDTATGVGLRPAPVAVVLEGDPGCLTKTSGLI